MRRSLVLLTLAAPAAAYLHARPLVPGVARHMSLRGGGVTMATVSTLLG